MHLIHYNEWVQHYAIRLVNQTENTLPQSETRGVINFHS